MEGIKAYLKVGSCCRKDNKLYFYNLSFNGVFYLDIKDLSIHFLHRFSHEPVDAKVISLNGSIIYEDAIYFFPNCTNAVMKYNFTEHSEEIIPIEGFKEKNFDMTGFIQQKDIVYLFPSDLGEGIYRLDLQNQKIEKDTDLSRLFRAGSLCGEIYRTSGDSILLNISGSDKLLEIDLYKKEIIRSRSVGEGIQIYMMCFDGHNYWFLQVNSTDIYEWDNENGTLQRYVNEHADREEEGSIPYANMIFLEKEILLLNYQRKSIARINKEKKTIEDHVSFPEDFRLVNLKYYQWPYCRKYHILEEDVLIYPESGNMLLSYNKESCLISGKEMQISEKEVPYLKDILKKKLCVEYDDIETLGNFMDVIIEMEDDKQLFTEKNIGRLIYEQINRS